MQSPEIEPADQLPQHLDRELRRGVGRCLAGYEQRDQGNAWRPWLWFHAEGAEEPRGAEDCNGNFTRAAGRGKRQTAESVGRGSEAPRRSSKCSKGLAESDVGKRGGPDSACSSPRPPPSALLLLSWPSRALGRLSAPPREPKQCAQRVLPLMTRRRERVVLLRRSAIPDRVGGPRRGDQGQATRQEAASVSDHGGLLRSTYQTSRRRSVTGTPGCRFPSGLE